MKIKITILTTISICLILTSTFSMAESPEIVVLSPKAKKSLNKAQLAEIKKITESEDIVIVQAATLPAPGRLVCNSWWVGGDGIFPANSWFCDTEYYCPPTMTAIYVDDGTGTRLECDYDCGGQPTSGWMGGASCDCDLQSGQDPRCPS